MANRLWAWVAGLLGRREVTIKDDISPDDFNAAMRRRSEAAQALQKAEREGIEQGDEEATRRREDRLVQELVEVIPFRMAAAADNGLNRALAMKLHRDEHFKRPLGNADINRCEPEWLIGPARQVYDHCVEMGRQPTIEKYDAGIIHPFAIVVHW